MGAFCMRAAELRQRGDIHRGSRCDRIMELIDEGWEDAAIAKKYGTGSDTIAVYRMWHDDKLTPAGHEGPIEQGRKGARDGAQPKYEIAYELRASGLRYREIAEILGKSTHSVRNMVSRYCVLHGLQGDPAKKNKRKGGDEP